MGNVTSINGRKKKSSAATPARKKSSTTGAKPVKCSHCLGVNGRHSATCPDSRCTECKSLISIGHLKGCSKYPSSINKMAAKKTTTSVTVDGKDATLTAHPATPAAKPIQPYPQIQVNADDLTALQRTIDRGDFSGDKQLKEKCDYEDFIDGHAVACPHIAAMVKMVKETCPECERTHKETVEKFCIGHGIMVWGGNAPSRRQTEMSLK